MKDNKAFTILFAVITSSLILALGLGIVAITMKEVKLSGAGRDSQLAFYAADSGLECAEYYDVVNGAFATSSESVGYSTEIECNNYDVQVNPIYSGGDSATSTFEMYMEYDHDNSAPIVSKPCATVKVYKYAGKTTIDSRGYNTCNEDNPSRLERGYSVKY